MKLYYTWQCIMGVGTSVLQRDTSYFREITLRSVLRECDN